MTPVWFSVRRMVESSAVSSSTPRSRVVRSLARAAERPCARPGCPAPARATLTFAYGSAEVYLDRLGEQVDPQGYDLCAPHAARTEPPRGWDLTDRRPEDDRAAADAPPPVTRDLGGEATVALLAAALRAVPERRPATTPEPTAAAPVDARPVPPVPASGVVTPPPDPARRSGLAAPPRRRRSAVEALLASGEDTEIAVTTSRRDTREEPTIELPRLRAPRRVPAAGDRGPATDW
jgi:hypothetical protein